jgi:Ca-activated chloride channel family protein
LYEIIPAGSKETLNNIDPLKYQQTNMTNYALNSDEIMTVKFRYKAPNENVSKLIEQPVTEKDLNKVPTNNFKWAATVAEFGMLLRDSKFKGSANYDGLLAMAKSAKGDDEEGYRAEMIKLIEKAELLKK